MVCVLNYTCIILKEEEKYWPSTISLLLRKFKKCSLITATQFTGAYSNNTQCSTGLFLALPWIAWLIEYFVREWRKSPKWRAHLLPPLCLYISYHSLLTLAGENTILLYCNLGDEGQTRRTKKVKVMNCARRWL